MINIPLSHHWWAVGEHTLPPPPLQTGGVWGGEISLPSIDHPQIPPAPTPSVCKGAVPRGEEGWLWFSDVYSTPKLMICRELQYNFRQSGHFY